MDKIKQPLTWSVSSDPKSSHFSSHLNKISRKICLIIITCLLRLIRTFHVCPKAKSETKDQTTLGTLTWFIEIRGMNWIQSLRNVNHHYVDERAATSMLKTWNHPMIAAKITLVNSLLFRNANEAHFLHSCLDGLSQSSQDSFRFANMDRNLCHMTIIRSLPSSCTAFSQAFAFNWFRWRISVERPGLFAPGHVTRNEWPRRNIEA